MKTTVIYHRADFDGIFCREIARKFMPEANLIGWDYGDPVPDPSVVSADDILYMLDISVEGLMDRNGLIWIDHHKSAMEKYHHGIPGYRIDGVAACRLAWQWFNRVSSEVSIKYGVSRYTEGVEPHNNNVDLPSKQAFFDRIVEEPWAVRLAGEYDVWDKRDPEAEVFQFGLRSRDLSNDWGLLLSLDRHASVDEVSTLIDVGHRGILKPDGTVMNPIVCGLLDSGKLLQRYQREQDAGLVKRGFDVEFEGKKFLALNVARCNSLTFESAALPGHEGLMGFYWTGKEWSVSLYHSPYHKEHDLSLIASKYGGGGHRGACGFRTATLPFIE